MPWNWDESDLLDLLQAAGVVFVVYTVLLVGGMWLRGELG